MDNDFSLFLEKFRIIDPPGWQLDLTYRRSIRHPAGGIRNIPALFKNPDFSFRIETSDLTGGTHSGSDASDNNKTLGCHGGSPLSDIFCRRPGFEAISAISLCQAKNRNGIVLNFEALAMSNA
jgi:hypothetical protein